MTSHRKKATKKKPYKSNNRTPIGFFVASSLAIISLITPTNVLSLTEKSHSHIVDKANQKEESAEPFCGADLVPLGIPAGLEKANREREAKYTKPQQDALIALLKRADVDGSHSLSIAEAKSFGMSSYTFKDIDRDRSGLILPREVSIWIYNQVLSVVRSRFAHADINGDSQISFREAQFEFYLQRTKFDELDKDNSGYLSVTEISPTQQRIASMLVNSFGRQLNKSSSRQ